MNEEKVIKALKWMKKQCKKNTEIVSEEQGENGELIKTTRTYCTNCKVSAACLIVESSLEDVWSDSPVFDPRLMEFEVDVNEKR